MVLRFPLLLLTVLHTVMSSIDFDACGEHSMCVLHKDCLAVSGVEDWHVYTNNGLNNPCSKAVAITLVSPSEWEVAMQGMRKLDTLVDCTTGTATAINPKTVARSRQPLAASPGRTAPQSACRFNVNTKDGTSLSKLLGTSTITVDGANTHVPYADVDKTSCHLVEALFDSECEETGICTAPIHIRTGDSEQWVCEPPLAMRSTLFPYVDWTHVDEVRCEGGVASSITGSAATPLTNATRIACRSKAIDVCDDATPSCDQCSLKQVPSLPAQIQCKSGYTMNADNWSARSLTCSAMSDLDYPVWETDGGRLVTVERVKCIRAVACSMQQFTFECGVYRSDCPDKYCRGENVTTVWPTGSNQTYGLEVDGLTFDNATGMCRAKPIYGDGSKRMIKLKSGDKVSCMSRSQQTAARSSVQLLHEKICSIALPALFLLVLLMCLLMLYTQARCVVTRHFNGRNRTHHAQVTKDIASNTLDSETQMKDYTLQSRFGEPPKESLWECLQRFFKTQFGKRDKDPSTRKSTIMKSDEEEEKDKDKLTTARGLAIDLAPPPKDSAGEQSAEPPSTAPVQEQPTTRPEEAQPPSSLAKLTSASTREEKMRTNKEAEPPSQTNNVTSSST